MTLSIDHIFVCTAVDAPESHALLEAGFVEGSRNVHPGQGTANRRFFFEHGFLELLWVHDEREATSAITEPTRLWQRWSNRSTSANPFGICFSSRTPADHQLPFDSWAYEPAYLPAGKRINFAKSSTLAEPELFSLSGPQPSAEAVPQPRAHRLPLRSMLSVSVGLSAPENLSSPLRAARDAGLVRVHRSPDPELVIEFSSTHPLLLHIPALGITLQGQPRGAA